MTIVLGIESTSHTFGVGILKHEDDKTEFLANYKSVFKPEKGKGIDPSICAQHHKDVREKVLKKALDKACISLEQVDVIAYSCGPGLPPCLLAGLELVQKISSDYNISVVPVNHCIAHIEIAKFSGGLKDSIILYVSGGNTQVIGYSEGRYRIFGETMDIGIGNAFDVFAREIGLDFPGGPKIDELSRNGKERGNYIELPYVVKGMDLSFSGIVSDAVRRWNKSDKSHKFKEDLCFSFQETVFAMLTEVAERALSHTKKNEFVLTGGVAASERLQEMLSMMCRDRGVIFYGCPREYAGDNGLMIAYAGLIQYNTGKCVIDGNKADFNPSWRTDEVDVSWI
ncbi:MAG: tRNA (adenosine(37)-N6)-threonylcarbamoyltransferase complex transferase subunit TsaD [Candidatus Aenigmarchaeota archaeon]|nr:tRNA (adenosine(37)-N6)-threonylcarbamoyltransferase complex transferase subunit TsaD [Candidatus Aenigmarchaeota archaeon]